MEAEIRVETDKKIYTVAELTRHIRFTLENAFGRVWVEGELSNFTHHGSGHMYFSVKDAEASIQAVMFRGENARLKFKPGEGMKVVCRGRVSVYPPRGQYQLVIETMEPKGIGALQIAFEQLKKRLAEEGLFDDARKRQIPYFPSRIGIVTSLTGAVIRDMMHVFERRHPGAQLVVAPVQVQGDAAKGEIVQAIGDFNAWGKVDVIVLARGGGSLEDLWAFNEEIVARAIAGSRIPVVSAIGHEVDYTIADFVADLRAPTPSAAAELLLPEKKELTARLEEMRKYAERAILERIESLREEIRSLVRSGGLTEPKKRLEESFQRLDEARKSLKSAIAHFVELTQGELGAVVGRLEELSPLACLVRGYSITFEAKTGKVIRSVKGLAAGDRIDTHLGDGRVRSRVEDITNHKEGEAHG